MITVRRKAGLTTIQIRGEARFIHTILIALSVYLK
jgi:hypothetical protein